MIGALISAVLPVSLARNRQGWVAQKYSLYLSQQAVHHHYDSLCLALGVLQHLDNPAEQEVWLLRIEEAASKCASAVDDCIAKWE